MTEAKTGERRKISLGAQIEEIDREIRLRQGVYPRQIANGSMRESVAKEHMARLEAARATLAWLLTNETAVRGAVKESQR